MGTLLDLAPSGSLVLNGRYDVDVLRDGGMSTVYHGLDRVSGRAVVVKTAATADSERSSSLMREREMLLRMNHPGIVRSLDLFEDGGRICLVLEKVDGRDLEELLRLREVTVDERKAREWAEQIGRILDYLHHLAPPVVYRDLKPSNLVLREDGRLVLVDFGAARVKTAASAGRGDTVALGTPGYAAPEQYGAATDERTDVYGLGVTLFELLTRRDPADFNFRFPSPRELGVAVSTRLEAVLRRATAPEAAARYPSVRALLRDLNPSVPRLPPLTPLAVAILAWATALLASAAESGGPGQRYACGMQLFGGGLLLGLGPFPRGTSARQAFRSPAVLAALGAAVAFGALPLTVSGELFNGLMRRLVLALGGGTVPLHPPIAAWCALGAWVAVLGALTGRAVLRRHAWIAVAALLLGTLSLLAVLLAGATASAVEAGAPGIEATPLWSVPLGGNAVHEVALIRAPGGPVPFVAVRDDRALTVREGLRGWQVWYTPLAPSQPVALDGERAWIGDASTLTLYDAASGQMRWRNATPASVERIQCLRRGAYAMLSDGRVAALDPLRRRITWTWHEPGVGAELVGRQGETLLLMAHAPSRLFGVDAATGRTRWSHEVDVRRGFVLLRDGRRALCLGLREAQALDAASGRVAFQLALPVDAASATVGIQPFHAISLDDDRLVLNRNGCIAALHLPDGAVTWRAEVPGEGATVREPMPGMLCVATESGRLLGLEARSGRVTWEQWAGTWQDFVLRGVAPGLSYLQAVGPMLFFQTPASDALCALDPESGRTAWRRDLGPEVQVRRVICEDERMFLLTSNPSREYLLQALPWAAPPQRRALP